ncbi:unnamed protein product [Brassicogethes aeneus]|uniref:Protein VAC14 homolog n=1 Tax=Brassicogethes aeneus TaxID=1431903 RepID=A0A9P0AYY5_BRAAE|nr:unnamed protein product [Brassicogethes aeneus]
MFSFLNTVTDIKETATAVNYTLLKLIALQQELEDADEIRKSSVEPSQEKLDLPPVVDVLTQYLMHSSIQTKVAVLKWIHDLYMKFPSQMVNHIDLLFPALQRTLADEADQVVQQCLVVIAEVISSPIGDGKTNSTDKTSTYYNKFVISLLQSFNNDKRLLDERGSFIIRQLCVLLNAEEIYKSLASILLKEPNLKFVRLMVEHLNMILLTSSELFEMRNKLKELKTEESKSLFCCLYSTWCHNPIATVSLCLLSQNYEHVCELIKLFGNLEITVDFLMEIDKLVQLIESPIFAYLRLELLEVPCDKNLVRALYGLLMLLPQTEAFNTLKIRLSCIPSLHLTTEESTTPHAKKQSLKNLIDFKTLLEHFKEVQEKHKVYKQAIRAKEILNL